MASQTQNTWDIRISWHLDYQAVLSSTISRLMAAARRCALVSSGSLASGVCGVVHGLAELACLQVGFDVDNLSDCSNCCKVCLLTVCLCYTFRVLLASRLPPLLYFSVWLACCWLCRGLRRATALGKLVSLR